MSPFIWVDRWGCDAADRTRCREAVPDGWRSVSFHQCTRKASIFRDVNGTTYGFCRTHDPVEVEKRENEREARWRDEANAQSRQWKKERETKEAFAACKAALEQIEAGHNDPRTLARETLALFPK